MFRRVRPLTPTGAALDLAGWEESSGEILLDSFPAGKPSTEVPQDTDLGDGHDRAPKTLEASIGQRLELVFSPGQSKSAGAESSADDEPILDLFSTQDRDFSPILSGSDDFSESLVSRLWDDDDEDQPQEHFLRTKSTRVPMDSLASQTALDRAHHQRS